MQGVVAQLEGRLKQALDASRVSVAEALNPRIAGSPVADFLATLRRELEVGEKGQQARLDAVTAQLDANDERSLLSQLVRRTREAHAVWSIRRWTRHRRRWREHPPRAGARDPAQTSRPGATVARTLAVRAGDDGGGRVLVARPVTGCPSPTSEAAAGFVA